MKIKIISVGKLKEKYLKDAIAEYSKRLSRFCDFSIVELPDEKIPDNASLADEEKVLRLEGDKILSKIGTQDHIIALCVEGKQMSSEKFADCIEALALGGKSNITFIIGGSLGLSPEVKKRADLSLSFSVMTFPHQLMRLFLTEQIYRAFKINANEKYHK